MLRFHYEPALGPTVELASSLADPELLSALEALGRELDLAPTVRQQLLAAHLPLCRVIDHRRRSHGGPLVVGVSGAQGSGKTTFRRIAQVVLEQLFGWRVCGFSIDDLYLDSGQRRTLARRVHPLFATRGVPGTHDVALGLDLLARLRGVGGGADEAVAIPLFDKATDNRVPREDWPVQRVPADVVIFEGWCVGARPQADDQLKPPINALEAREDADGTWRRQVNQHLRGDYATLFGQLDLLIFLQVPGFEQVRRWRRLQEEKLARRRPDAPGIMDASALDRFLMHYERTTRHALVCLPEVADMVCRLDADHRIVRIDSWECLELEPM